MEFWSSKQFMEYPICVVGTQSRKSSSLGVSEKVHAIILMRLLNATNYIYRGRTSRINLLWFILEFKCFTLTGKSKCTIIFEEKKSLCINHGKIMSTTKYRITPSHILQWWNLAQLYLSQRGSKKYINHVTHHLSSADISIFSLEISKFCYIKKYRYRFHFDT